MATVNIDDIKPNSHKYREEHPEEFQDTTSQRPERRVPENTHISARTKKRGLTSKLADTFLSRDLSDIKSSIIYDIVIPTIEDAIVDAVSEIFSAGGRRSRRSSEPRDYGKYSRTRRSSSGRDDRDRNRVRDVADINEEIVFETYGDAEYALGQLDDLMDRYHQVRVADLYDLVQKTCKTTCYNYGWYDIRDAYVKRRGRNDYIIVLPKSEPLR